jgi:hypothetical protein
LHLDFEKGPEQAAPYAARASWLTPSLEDSGHAVGCFQYANANFEGITVLPKEVLPKEVLPREVLPREVLPGKGLLLAAERQPRGLMELEGDRAVGSIKAWAMPESVYPLPVGRPPDFADLATTGGQVYALLRNAHLVVRLRRTTRGWAEGEAWSYAATENDERFAYADQKFGMAEGLAFGEDEVFIILDNNGIPRAASAEDRRPLLYVFARPLDL